MTIQLYLRLRRPLKRRTARRARRKANLRWRGARRVEALPSPFTTLLQIDIAAAAEIIAVMSQSPPSLPPGRVPATASTSLIHHNKSIAREAKIDVEMGREGGRGRHSKLVRHGGSGGAAGACKFKIERCHSLRKEEEQEEEGPIRVQATLSPQ